MKKLLILSVLFPLFLFSCKKQNSDGNPANDGKAVVTFKVTTPFTSTKSTMSTQSAKKANALSPVHTQFLTALFYDYRSHLYRRIDQNTSQPDYGVIKIELPLIINLRVFFIATADSSYKISVENSPDGPGSMYPGGVPVLSYPNTIFPPNGEIYTAVKEISGGFKGYDIQLTRAVSQVTVTLSDILPLSAVNNMLKISNLQYATGLDLVKGVGYTPSYTTGTYNLPPAPTIDDVYKTDFTRTFYMWPAQNSAVKIANGNYVSDDIPVPDGKFMPNQQYTFKGYLFPPFNPLPHMNPPQAFGIFLNSDWNTPITVPISVPSR